MTREFDPTQFSPGDVLQKVPRWGLLVPPLAIFALAVLFTSYYTVAPEEKGVVLRFGAYVTTTDSGLHFKLPLGIDTVKKVPVQRQLKEEFGFRTAVPGVRTVYAQENQATQGEALMLTGDLNIADVEWVVQYRVVDPQRFLFKVRNIRQTLRDMSEAAMRKVVGDRTVSEVLTVGRTEIASLVERDLQELCDQYETGIKIDQVVLQGVNPPEAVKDSFNDVNRAQQEREQKVNAAQELYNREVPKARGEALQELSQAKGYAADRVNRAQGDVARFKALYAQYERYPEVTRRRIYLETMGEVLPRAGKKVIVDDSLSGSMLPFLDLDPGGGGGRPAGLGGAR